jgi:hypothetical protein
MVIGFTTACAIISGVMVSVRYIVGSSLDLVKPKTINLVFVVTPQVTDKFYLSSTHRLIEIRTHNVSVDRPHAILVSDWLISKKLSPLKPLSQMNRNLVGSINGRFCIKFPQSRMKGERHRLSPLSF